MLSLCPIKKKSINLNKKKAGFCSTEKFEKRLIPSRSCEIIRKKIFMMIWEFGICLESPSSLFVYFNIYFSFQSYFVTGTLWFVKSSFLKRVPSKVFRKGQLKDVINIHYPVYHLKCAAGSRSFSPWIKCDRVNPCQPPVSLTNWRPPPNRCAAASARLNPTPPPTPITTIRDNSNALKTEMKRLVALLTDQLATSANWAKSVQTIIGNLILDEVVLRVAWNTILTCLKTC